MKAANISRDWEAIFRPSKEKNLNIKHNGDL